MADIRLVRRHGPPLWLVVSILAALAMAVWAAAFWIGDATAPDELPRVGAAADFGSVRAPVVPVEAVPFGTLTPIQTRDRGRLVRVSGVAESWVAANSVWVRTAEGYRLLVRFEPSPPPEQIRGISPGTAVNYTGYLQNIALAELQLIVDSLGIRLPRPPPARKFGDLPDPAFARIDSLYIKAYYVSVRPEGIENRAAAS